MHELMMTAILLVFASASCDFWNVSWNDYWSDFLSDYWSDSWNDYWSDFLSISMKVFCCNTRARDA
jgi:hypothetical protein